MSSAAKKLMYAVIIYYTNCQPESRIQQMQDNKAGILFFRRNEAAITSLIPLSVMQLEKSFLYTQAVHIHIYLTVDDSYIFYGLYQT